MQYDLTLVASDSLNESTTEVIIRINDSNDLPPVFNQTIYAAHILEELADPLPYRLLQVAPVLSHPKPHLHTGEDFQKFVKICKKKFFRFF